MNRYIGKTSQKIWFAVFIFMMLCVVVMYVPGLNSLVLGSVGMKSFGEPVQSIVERCLKAVFNALSILSAFMYARATSEGLSRSMHAAGNDFKAFFSDKTVFNRRNGMILLVMTVIVFIGFVSLIRADVDFLDDIDRNQAGSYAWGYYSSRWITEFANLFISGSYAGVTERSPLGQLIGMAMLVLSSFILALVFSRFSGRENLRWRNVLAGLIIAFNPYFLECMAYKYDSVGMAMSVLFPFIPFLFTDRKELFLVSSFACNLLTYLSYQSSSGIYIVMVLFTGLLMYLQARMPFKEMVVYFVQSALMYVASVAVFYVVFRTAAPPVNELTELGFGMNVIDNILYYVQEIPRSFNWFWTLLAVIVFVLAFCSALHMTRRNRIATTLLFLATAAMAYVFSYGGYLFLVNNPHTARSLYGIVVFFAVLAQVSVLLPSFWFSIPACLLAWCFFSFSFAYGNAIGSQQEKELVYEHMVLSDFNRLFPKEEYPELDVVYYGKVQRSHEMDRLVQQFPISGKMSHVVNAGSSWIGGMRIGFLDSSIDKVSFDPDLSEFELVCSRRYYDILFDEDDQIVVVQGKAF